MTTFTITPTTTYSLRESAEFGFGGRTPEAFDGVMRLAFCLDGYTDQVGVELRQDDAGIVHGVVHGADHDAGHNAGHAGRNSVGQDGAAAVKAQVARVLSLDQDGSGFVDVGVRDPVIGRLQQAAPGLLPPLFYSPYEAAVWSVLSARRPAKQMAQVRTHLAERHGRIFELAGQRLAALPTPEQLLAVTEFPGLTAEKIHRMHGIARKALTGTLDADRLRHIGPDACQEDMQRLKGIGPFYASLITIRAVGFTDVLPADEPLLLELVALHYGLGAPVTREQFTRIADSWRPYRTWASVLVRAASRRVGVQGAGRRAG